jgi:hypothetical protein
MLPYGDGLAKFGDVESRQYGSGNGFSQGRISVDLLTWLRLAG